MMGKLGICHSLENTLKPEKQKVKIRSPLEYFFPISDIIYCKVITLGMVKAGNQNCCLAKLYMSDPLQTSKQ